MAFPLSSREISESEKSLLELSTENPTQAKADSESPEVSSYIYHRFFLTEVGGDKSTFLSYLKQSSCTEANIMVRTY